ncbi:TonB-dependent receptor [Parahaliea mediterranea]|uniref:TonB-dependent receptor n=1 Tax=Parahaliea mediterranea TaxID=651086 RepID=A0A939DGB8_9GAMM|nr:TonB-dependent receptor [Parahaliea mediterranea]MBN7797351.1 TonB-dependent receptor [Parahaliea mediterranea]
MKKDKTGIPRTRLSAAVSLALLAAGPVAAQQLEEVVVTAQKRQQSMQDIGISVTAFSGNKLRELGMTSSTDIVTMTPGLNYTTPNAEGSQTNFFLRGVGLNDFTDANENPVAVYMDEVYRGAMAGLSFQLFDIQRVEVLRGPQGTLFGRNTTGGLVHFLSEPPTEEFSGYADLTLGEESEVKFEGAIGGAISDTLMGRLSVATHDYDPYVKNRLGRDYNGLESRAARGQLKWVPSDTFDVLLSANYAKNDAEVGAWQHQSTKFGADGFTSVALPGNEDFWGTCPGCDVFGYSDTDGDPWAGDYDREGTVYVKSEGGAATINWDLNDSLTLTSITAYQTVERTQEEDTDAGPVPLAPSFPAETDQFTQELRLSGGDDRSQWVAGVYYYDSEVEATYTLDALGLGFVFLDTDMTQDTESWSVFGQYEFAINDQWSVIAGLRYSSEEKELDYQGFDRSGIFAAETAAGNLPLTPTRPLPDSTFFFSTDTVGSLAKHDETNVTGKLELDWRPADDLLLYASYSRGTKSAGFNTGFLDETFIFASNVPETVPYDEEVLDAFEVGFKSDLAGGLVRLNGAAFYYDYSDLQTFRFELLNQVIFNTDGQYWGGELELTAAPMEGLDLALGAAYLDTTVEDVPDGAGVPRDRTAVSAPDWSLNASARYEWGFMEGTMAALATYSYQGETYFDIQNPDIAQEEGYSLANVRLEWASPSDAWILSAFVNNVTDEEYLVYTFDFTGSFGFNQQAYGKPRWAGVSARYSF